MQLGFLSLQKKIPLHKPSHHTLQKKLIKRASGKLRHCERRMEAQHPEGACDARVAARFDFVSPRLMLGPHYYTSWQGSKPNMLASFTHSRSQVKLSELIVVKQKQWSCTWPLLQRLWWQLHAPCFWNVSCAVQIPNAPQRCRWISQSRGSTRSISAT